MRTGFHSQAEPQRPLGWSDLVDLADTPQKLVSLARDYVATWDPWEVNALPVDCRPPHLLDPESIVEYAFALAHYERLSGADDSGVRRMASFFSQAAQRAAALMSASPGAPAENDPQA
jgi:hypothetical protein